MKNIVKVLRYKDDAARLYLLPEGMTIKTGCLVTVEYPTRYSTCAGVAVSDSYLVDEAAEKMVADLHRIHPTNLDGLKKVISVYDETPCVWPDDHTDTEDDE